MARTRTAVKARPSRRSAKPARRSRAARAGSPRSARKFVIGVHLDLKGMMFKDAYIPQLMADLAGQGVNAVLVEYEDAFPYEGLDIAYDRSVRWSKETLRLFLAEAKKNGVEVIPLIQCLGHLEYVLGYDRYRDLAEDRKYPSTINVTNPDAVALVTNMLEQVIAAHPDSRLIHLGMDEAHALKHAAERLKKSVLEVYLDHLRKLMPVVEAAGKKAYIWTDMLEDHFEPDAFDEFRGRVIFGTWDYSMRGGDALPWARLVGGSTSGTRVSREWLKEPANPEAPPIGAGTPWVEDYPARIKKVLAPYKKGRFYLRNFHVDMWSKLGMECLPVSALRISSNYSTMPQYNGLLNNIRGWSVALKRTGQLGQIGTSWGRGTSWCPPNYPPDLQWPLVTEMARTMGAKPKAFWPGVPQATIDRIIGTLGRSREDWRLEVRTAEEMEKLSPRVKEHRWEWDAIALMARVLDLQRRADYNLAEVDYFAPNHRPVDTEWQRRLDEQAKTLTDIAAMRKRLEEHFGQRYHGLAFREWIDQLFLVHETRLNEVRAICEKKKKLAEEFYRR